MKIRISSPTDANLTREWYWESTEPFIKHRPGDIVEMMLPDIIDKITLMLGRTQNYGSNTINIEIVP